MSRPTGRTTGSTFLQYYRDWGYDWEWYDYWEYDWFETIHGATSVQSMSVGEDPGVRDSVFGYPRHLPGQSEDTSEANDRPGV